MAAFFYLLLLFIAACIFDTIECFILIQFPDVSQQLINQWESVLGYLDYALWLPMVGLAAL